MELVDEITSLVDNELKDKEIAKRLQKIIADDQALLKEYVIQKSIKNLLNSRLTLDKLPPCLCNRLKNILNIESKKSTNK